MPSISLTTRKPVDKLCAADFASFPVWEYASDEEDVDSRDETWVRPVDTLVVPKRSYTHVAATFTTPTKKKYKGYVTVSTLDGAPEVCQGNLFFRKKSLFISNPEAFCFEESREELLSVLKIAEKDFFPLSFELLVPVSGAKFYSGGSLP